MTKPLNKHKEEENRVSMTKLDWNDKFEKIFEEFEQNESDLVKVN